MAREFLDSNVLVYAFTTDARGGAAQALLQRGCAISVQALNEFTNVARRKLRLPWEEIREALAAIRIMCPIVVPVDSTTHDFALDLAEAHGFAFFDALIVAAALQSDDALIVAAALQADADTSGLRTCSTDRLSAESFAS